jgi:hypothetical protein
MDGDGNHRKRISAPGQAVPESLAWSGDASRLAFWTREDSADVEDTPFRLCVTATTKPESAEVVYTAEPGLGGDRPFFSATGNVLCASVFGGEDAQNSVAAGLLARRFTRNKGLLKFRLAGGPPEPVLPDRPAARGPLRWPELAPDGQTLVAIAGKDIADGHLALVDLDARSVTQERERDALCAAWSPRQRRLAYLRHAEHGTTELRVWTLDGPESALVVDGLSAEATFAWAPDGESIAYTNRDEFAVVTEGPGGEWVAARSQHQEGSLHRWPTWAPKAEAVVLQMRPSGQRERILLRDPISPDVSSKRFFPGGTRPLFAPG